MPLACATVASAAYDVTVSDDWAATERLWRPLMEAGVPTPFQDGAWLRTWYATLGTRPGTRPLLVTVRDTETGRIAAALPWAMAREGGLRVVGFADGGITDYNAALLGPAAPADPAAWSRLAAAVRAALPPADLLRLTKLAGPVAAWPGAAPMALNGNLIRIDGPWEAFHRGLERTFRKELERSGRVFARHDGAAFRRILDPAEAGPVLTALEGLQRARIADLGLPYILDDPAVARHYRTLVERGLGDGGVVLTALTAGAEVVGALLGLRSGEHYAMVRLAAAGGPWRNASPGRLLIARTLEHLHGQGVRTFDFTIGDYDYKRRFGVVSVPLTTVLSPLSPRGLPSWGADRARRLAKRQAWIVALRRRLKGGRRVAGAPAKGAKV
ncbi:GNAT family N-acetyltransferase [Methylobacterium gossipiicola]|uniref:Acetyltransferase involved in cellulose biosynthesis, CelD/BcsL family n=1 Tax=Methylobacterium gossipiicola TaxID=582675 RepID=A0A1I2TDF5_9HYPH|nr:GNAT family N-acetyltransferase [Methylobacterium gossipiicola]SFG60626.1 Acetyltransferase involved in cellulose biosynthesis, CelD/BcsL family [Methylobacterium gossipiicola]